MRAHQHPPTCRPPAGPTPSGIAVQRSGSALFWLIGCRGKPSTHQWDARQGGLGGNHRPNIAMRDTLCKNEARLRHCSMRGNKSVRGNPPDRPRRRPVRVLGCTSEGRQSSVTMTNQARRGAPRRLRRQNGLGLGDLGDQLAAIISDVGLGDDCGSTDVQRLATAGQHRPGQAPRRGLAQMPRPGR